MKLTPLLLAIWMTGTILWAQPANTLAVIDAGGRPATSVNYSQISSISTMSHNVAQAAGANVTSKTGFIGQICKVNGLALTTSLVQLPELQSVRLLPFATLDDGSLLAIPSITLPENAVAYAATSSWLAVTTDGFATAAAVYQTERGVLSGATWNGFTATLQPSLTILNTDPDNFAPYALDSVDDAWQVQFFGLNNVLNGRGDFDADGDGTSNLLEWSAGTDPLDAGSRLAVTTSTAQPDGSFVLTFSSIVGRSYLIERSTTLSSGSWIVIATVQATSDTTLFTDASPPSGAAFYRLKPVMP
ncbi:MAG: thrombospondin type 3 repeat-containing protein [Verrucomicrobiota bacterium]